MICFSWLWKPYTKMSIWLPWSDILRVCFSKNSLQNVHYDGKIKSKVKPQIRPAPSIKTQRLRNRYHYWLRVNIPLNNILHLYRCLRKWMSWVMLLSPISSWISMYINENCIVKYWSGYLNRWDLFLFKYISKKLGESINKTCRQDPTPRPKRQDIL